jgi:hypothetical protein
MHKWIVNYWALILVIVVGLTPLLWFTPGNIITGTDIDFSPSPQERFEHRSYLWDGKILGGTDRSNNVASLVYIAPNALLQILGFDLETNQKIGFVMWFELVGLSMYLLMSLIFNKNKKSIYAQNLGKLAASTLYMFGFYNMFLWVRLQLSLTTLILVPLYIGILIATQKGIIKLRTAISFAVILGLLSAPTGLQPPLLYIFFLFIVLYLLFAIFAMRPAVFILKAKEFSKSWLLIGMSFIIGSLFWLTPLISYVVSAGYGDSAVGKDVYEVYSLIDWVSKPLSFDNIFRFYGDVIWHDSWGGQPYFPDFEEYLRSPVLILLSFVIPILVFLPLFIVRRTQYRFFILFFSFIAILSLFLSKGVHSPFGSLYLWLVDNVPMFWIQRAPWQKFALFTSVSYSVLFGFSMYYLSTKIKITSQVNLWNFTKKNKLAIVTPLILLTFLLGFHYIFTLGKMFSVGSGNRGYHEVNGLGMHHSYPDYLYLSRDFINSQKQDFKILLLPDEKTSIYSWGYAGAALPSLQLFNKGIIFRQYGEGIAPPNSIDAMQNKAIDLLYNKESIDFAKFLGRMNVKYILQRNDFRYDFFNDYDSPVFIKDRLSKQPGVYLEKTIGAWDFYKVDDKLVKPLINLYKHSVPVENLSQNNTNYFSNNITFDLKEIVRDAKNNPDILNLVNRLNRPSKEQNNSIKFKRINNSKLIIRLNNVKGVYSLNFLENFDKNWKAYLAPIAYSSTDSTLIKNNQRNIFSSARVNDTWFSHDFFNNSLSNPVVMKFPKMSHFKANNFSNSWIFDTKEICEETSNCFKRSDGSFDIEVVLEFWPQRLFIISTLISGFALIISILYLLSLLLIRRSRNA